MERELSVLESLPQEVFEHIFDGLDCEAVASLEQTSKKMREMVVGAFKRPAQLVHSYKSEFFKPLTACLNANYHRRIQSFPYVHFGPTQPKKNIVRTLNIDGIIVKETDLLVDPELADKVKRYQDALID